MRSFRNRLRHKHLKALSTGSMAGLTPVFLMIFIGLWWDTHCTGYFGSTEYYMPRFVEVSHHVSAWIDDYRAEHSCLPDSLQIDWLTASEWEENVYSEDRKYNSVSFRYVQCTDDDGYKLVDLDGRARFVSTSDSSWFSYCYWDFEADTVIWVKQSVNASAPGRR